jgi:hypothetical protein
MPYQLIKGEDGVLRLLLDGDLGNDDAKTLPRDIAPFLEAATEAEPLVALVDSTRSEKVSSRARRFLADLNSDPRMGKVAILGARRYGRVLIGFIIRATGRDDYFRFFDSEEEAVSWLTEGAQK